MTPRSKLLSDRVKLAEAQAEQPEARALEMIANELTAQGTGRSGALVMARHERRVETVRSLLAERLRLEREYPLGSADVTSWYDDLVEDINGIINRNVAQLERGLRKDWGELGPEPDAVARQFGDEIDRLRRHHLGKADIIRQERQLETPKLTTPSSLTLNISGSQIASLNLGQIIGDIQATVSGLNAAGQPEIAEALKRLAEAVAADPALDELQKRETVEVVADLGDEFAKDRRPSRLRAFGARVGQLVTGTSAAYGAYQALKAALLAAGVELP